MGGVGWGWVVWWLGGLRLTSTIVVVEVEAEFGNSLVNENKNFHMTNGPLYSEQDITMIDMDSKK